MTERYLFPKKRNKLEDYYEDSLKCNKCNYCKVTFSPETPSAEYSDLCPRGQEFNYEAYYASGTHEIARAFTEGRLQNWDSDRLAHIIYTCTMCGACEHWCENTQGTHPMWVMEALRNKFVDEHGPIPEHQKVADQLERTYNPYGESHGDRFDWLPEDMSLPNEADYMYFAGCSPSYREKQTGRATVQVLDKLGLDFGILGDDEWCCGFPLTTVGMEEKGKEMLKHNIEALESAGAEKVIASCPECVKVFNDAEALGLGSPEFEVVHVSEVVSSRLDEADLKRPDEIEITWDAGMEDGEWERDVRKVEPDEKVTYHDPCNLGRISKVFEEPREVIKKIPGVELVEFPRNRSNGYCCGSGGGVEFTYPEFARSISSNRIEEFQSTDADDTILSACPFCESSLRTVARREDTGIQVYDIMELLNASLEVK